MRAVVDTNILIRALLKPQGTVAPVLSRLRDGDYVLLYSTEILEEIADVLGRARFRNKYGIRDRDVEALLTLLVLRGEKVVPSQRIEVCRDPKDDKFLEVAVAGQAEVLVTGDRDLPVLSPFREVPFLTPAEFLGRLG